MEEVSSDFGNYQMVSTPERSPTQSSSISNSPSPERHPTNNTSPQSGGAANDHSWHIIVEPQLDGQTNIIHLTNPPSGQIVSSFIAENGAHIEIQPGVFFRVPFPHEHGYPYSTTQMPMPSHQQAQYQSAYHDGMGTPLVAPSVQEATEVHGVVPPYYVFNPTCVVHGNNLSLQPGPHCSEAAPEDRLGKQREKLQKKLREKNMQLNQCTCYAHQNGSMQDNFSLNVHQSKVHVLQGEKCLPSMDGTFPEVIDGENITLKTVAEGPYSVGISWEDRSVSANMVQIHHYKLECSDKANNFKCIYTGGEKCFTASELLPGTEYKFRVCAVVAEKCGSYCNVVTCTTPCTIPERPIHPRISQRTKNMLMLKWNAPPDGGSPITQYKLQWSKGDDLTHFSDLYVGLQKQYKHNHRLPPLTPCMFRIQVDNAIGSSEFSDPLECLTSAGLPGAPDKPTVDSYGIDFIKLSWIPPECNGAPIEEYRLEMEDPTEGYGFMTKYCGEKLTYTCTGLWRNTRYKFRLLASNNQGSSKYSTVVEYSTLAETPGKMEKVKLNGKAKTQAIPVKWDPPKDNGGEEIIGYILQVSHCQGGDLVKVYHGPDLEFTVENLKGGTAYQMNVASESRAGVGPYSPLATLSTLPVSPRNLSVPRLSRQDLTTLHLEWDPPADTGGAPISNYILKMAETPKEEFKQVYSGELKGCTVSGLQCGSDYSFKLQASNSVGPSPWTKVVVFQTIPGPPDAVSPMLVSFKSPTHVRFDWSEPATHGAPVTGYIVEKLENQVFQKVYEGNSLYCEVKKNLQPANMYFFRIVATSNAGVSPHGSISTVETPPGPPGTIADIKVVEQTSNSCLIQWRNPVENGSRVFEYVIEAIGATSLVTTVKRPQVMTSGEIDTSCSSSDTTSLDGSFHDNDNETSESSSASTTSDNLMEYRLTGLSADASYKLRIQAVNDVGTSPFSHAVNFFTKELPPVPPTLIASSLSYHSVKLRWGEGLPKKALAGTSHNLQLQDKSGSFLTVYNGMGTSFTLNKLKELTPYCCRIKSRNHAGEGEYSKPVVICTKPQPPSAIKDLHAKDVGESHVLLEWSETDKIRPDDQIEYIVQKLHQDHDKELIMIYRGEKNECHISNLIPDQLYQFRVQAVRTVDEQAFQTPTSAASSNKQIKGVDQVNIHNNKEIKGIYSPVVPVKTLSRASVQPATDDETEKDEELAEDCQSCLSDTQLTLIILGSFLAICILTVVLLRGMINEY